MKISWKIFIDKPSKYNIDISYNFQKKITDGSLSIKVNNKKFKHSLKYTGKTVGEPIQDFIIDRFKSFTVGQIKFDYPGFYTVDLNIKTNPQNTLQWQWLWLDELEK